MKETAATLPTGAEEPELTVPRMADYEILGVLGEGGMGIVYKARDLRLDRFVALKMIRWGGSTRPEDLARFEAEAKAVAAIEHPNIVRIFEIGEYGGTPYCSLEFLAGGSLAERQGGKPLPAREAARVTELLAHAMTAVHRAGIIHRDLKPANVLYAADDTPKITDFGLVKRFEDESGRTRTGSILGTASYMAPEQARGEPNRIGPAADQYSLGAVLYELLTGRPPFRGVSVLDTLDQVRNNEPVPPSRLQPKLPRDLETICLKCLEKDPARRYPQVSALAEDLHRFASGEPIVARPVSAPERLGRWCLRNKVVAALTGVTLALLLTIVAGTVYGYLAPRRQNLALESANKRATRKQFEAEQKQRLAENVARFFHEQNRRALDTHVEMMNLLSSKLQHVPGIEDTRGAFLDKATKGVEVSAQAMIDIRQEIGSDPNDEQGNWRSLARSYQALANQNLQLHRFQDAFKQYQRMDEIVGQIAALTPDDPTARIRVAHCKRYLGYIAQHHLGDSLRAEKYYKQAIKLIEECLEKVPEQRRKERRSSETLPTRWACSPWVEMALGHLERAERFTGAKRVPRNVYGRTSEQHRVAQGAGGPLRTPRRALSSHESSGRGP